MPEMAALGAKSLYVLGDEELTLFLEYGGLPADQLGRILVAMAGLNQAVLTAVRDVQWQKGDLDLWPELHVTSIQTGESVDLKFKQGKNFPYLVFRDGDVDVVMPKWTVSLYLAGQLLIGTAAILGSVDVLMKHIPHHEQARVEQHVNLEQLVNPYSRAGRDSRLYLAGFKHEVDSPNILSARVNEAIIRKREEDEGPPSTPPSAV